MRIAELYRPEVFSVLATDPLWIAARRMQEAEVGALAVYTDDQLAGIISERDITRAVAAEEDPLATPVANYMSKKPYVADVNADSADVANRMLMMSVRHMPVVDGDRLVGMVSMRDLLAVEAWV